jgi:hypothetical protein
LAFAVLLQEIIERAVKRRGPVCSFTKRHAAYALWDGRRSTEIVPIAILETVQRSPSSSE